MKLEDLAQACSAEAQGELFVVGGTLRDRLLGRPTLDLDLVCKESAAALSKRLAAKLKGTLVVLDEGFQIYRIVLKDGRQVDLAQMQGETIEQDLGRRDFTVNAMAERLGSAPKVIDPFGGLKDLKAKKLRAVSEKAFKDDPLRLLRAYRISAELAFELEPKTEAWIKRHAKGVASVAGERVQAELAKLLSLPGSSAWLGRMDRTRLLTKVFPELEASRRCAHVYYGEGGVLTHSLATVERVDYLLAHLEAVYPELAPKLRAYLAERPPYLLRLSALLHDIAKPKTAKKREGRLRFFGHEEEGGKMSDEVLERLRFSQAVRSAVALMIRHHLRPGNLSANPQVSDRSAFRYYKDLGEEGLGLLLLCWADYMSYHPPSHFKKLLERAHEHPNGAQYGKLNADLVKTLRHLQVVNWLMDLRLKTPERVLPPKLIDGNDVMKTLKLPPGPAVGELLQKVQEAQAEGRVRNREEALRFIKKHKP